MTIASTPIRSTQAIGAQRPNVTAQHTKVDGGSFTRTHSGTTQVQADQGIGRRIASLLGISKPTSGEALSPNAQSLETIADIYESTVRNGQPLQMQIFGKPAVLSGLNGCMVLKSKYSADPSEPSGLLGFVNGKVAFAKSGHPGVPLTPKQEETMIAATLEKLTSSVERS